MTTPNAAVLDREREKALQSGKLPKHTEEKPKPVRPGHFDVRQASGHVLSPGSGMVSLDIPPGVLPQIPGGEDDHHITIVYLGKDVDDDLFDRVSEVAQTVAASSGPLSGSLGGLGTFEPSEASDGKIPVYAKPEIPGIEALRPPFEEFNASQHKEFHPHATLAYVDQGDPLPDPVPPTPITFTHLSVHRGDDVRYFAFTGGARDWAEWDLERATMEHARAHIHEAAKRFHDSGGTIEELNGRDDGPKLRAAERELIELRKGLVKANGGLPLTGRAAKGHQLAAVALSTGRADHTATIRIARTAEGHIAAVSASSPRPTLNPRAHYLAMMGSTGITHGAGSALVRAHMKKAAKKNHPVVLVPFDTEAAKHWRSTLAAHQVPRTEAELMGWTPEEVKELAKA